MIPKSPKCLISWKDRTGQNQAWEFSGNYLISGNLLENFLYKSIGKSLFSGYFVSTCSHACSSQITFKIFLYVFKNLNVQAPEYLTDLISYYKPARCLRSSSDTTSLVLHSSATGGNIIMHFSCFHLET